LTLQTALTRRIPDLCPPGRDPKLTTRLQESWTLPDFAAFRAEVKKVFKADIPLAERSAWEDWINRDRAEIARLSAEIAGAEAQIDRIVYELFGLTNSEILLLENGASKPVEGEEKSMDQILSTLGSIASIASLLIQGAQISRDRGGATVAVGDRAYRVDIATLRSAQELSETIIDPDLLKVLSEQMEKARKEYMNRLKRAESAQERDAADAYAQRNICDLLNRIRNRNEGKLCGAYFEKLWKSYKCQAAY
jgi:hypothetical protein